LIYLQQFDDGGLKGFIEEWNMKDSLLHQTVRLISNNNTVAGMGSGINEQGHLVLTLANGCTQTFASGDTTLIKEH
jgi:biotin-(acetyl-CoA carboxylase) ligase